MNIVGIYNALPSHIKESVKGSLLSEHVRILFYDAKTHIENELKYLSTDLAPEQFKLSYLEKQKAVQAYDDILYLIDNIKAGDTK